MTARTLTAFFAFWMAFALIGGIADGVILRGHDTSGAGAHSGDASIFQGAGQPAIGQEESSGGVLGFFGGIARGFQATVGLLTSVVGMLALNFSFFTGDWALIGWLFRGLISFTMAGMFLQMLRG